MCVYVYVCVTEGDYWKNWTPCRRRRFARSSNETSKIETVAVVGKYRYVRPNINLPLITPSLTASDQLSGTKFHRVRLCSRTHEKGSERVDFHLRMLFSTMSCGILVLCVFLLTIYLIRFVLRLYIYFLSSV